MKLKKSIDYSELFAAVDQTIAQQLPQMEFYCELGQLISDHPEKGAAVAVSKYLSDRYPEMTGFSPRSLRRMRDFYRTYENQPDVMRKAMRLGWMQNVVIFEADLTVQEREWYIRAACKFGWSKSELEKKIAENAYAKGISNEDPAAVHTAKRAIASHNAKNIAIAFLKRICVLPIIDSPQCFPRPPNINPFKVRDGSKRLRTQAIRVNVHNLRQMENFPTRVND